MNPTAANVVNVRTNKTEGTDAVVRNNIRQAETMLQEPVERSAYPHPEEFKVMRPEYTELEDEYFRATINVAPFRVTGESRTKAGARRAALYEADKTYRSYHPSYRVESPFPDEFVDREGVKWFRVPPSQRDELGDYRFVDESDEEDFADIDSMLAWDVRPNNANPEEEEEEEGEEEEEE